MLIIFISLLGENIHAVNFIHHCDFLKVKAVGSNDDVRVVIKENHTYYAQVQLGMFILNLKECDFILYSSFSKSFINVIVKFDVIFATTLVEKLKYNYFTYMLHEICKNKDNY